MRRASPRADAAPRRARRGRRSPLSTRRIARGRSAGVIRRESSRVRPLRRAADAAKLVRSPSGMPTRTTRPPGRTAASASARAPSSPAVSNATSTPRPPGAARRKLSGIDRVRHTAGGCHRGSVRERVGRDDDLGAGRTERLDDEQADRAAAEDARGRARLDLAEIERVQRNAERLEQRRLGVGEAVGDRVREPLGPREQRPQRAVGDAVAGEATVRAEVVESGEALGAAAARHRPDRPRPARPRAARLERRLRTRGRGRAGARAPRRRSPPRRTSAGRSRRGRPP